MNPEKCGLCGQDLSEVGGVAETDTEFAICQDCIDWCGEPAKEAKGNG